MHKQLFPDINTYHTHFIKVSDIHTIYVEESGNPNGTPIIYLHGGPGGRTSPKGRKFFDPTFYRIIQFDQRGAGFSTPHACLTENTTADLINDMEVIRNYLSIDKWILFGGSWGSTLALHYAIHHPSRVSAMILRGIFLGRQTDIDWLFQNGANAFYPDKWQQFIDEIPLSEHNNLINAYYKRFTSDDYTSKLHAARAWANWEGGIVSLIDKPTPPPTAESDKDALAIASIECHYFVHHNFVDDDNFILNNIDKIIDIPCFIVHGRYDVDCRFENAWLLHKALPKSHLEIAQDAGHSTFEPTITKILLEFTERVKQIF